MTPNSNSPANAADGTVSPGCDGCISHERRRFLASASVLSLGVLAAACGDGVIGGPEKILTYPTEPFQFDPRNDAALQTVGGQTVVRREGFAPIWIKRTGASTYKGLSLVCPHRGTVVNVQSAGFTCPNHGARYAADGAYISGPLAAGLTNVLVKVNPDGTLRVGGYDI